MLGMFGALAWSFDALPLVERPATTSLAVAVLATLAGWALHVWAERSTSIDDDRPGRRHPARSAARAG